MTPTIHALVLTSIAVAIFTVVMAWGWVGSVDRRLRELERSRDADRSTD
ncbi:MAG: hypothetical protein QM655_11625 [Nocardioidaceae bacterium]